MEPFLSKKTKRVPHSFTQGTRFNAGFSLKIQIHCFVELHIISIITNPHNFPQLTISPFTISTLRIISSNSVNNLIFVMVKCCFLCGTD
jgi:hypothetical protein